MQYPIILMVLFFYFPTKQLVAKNPSLSFSGLQLYYGTSFQKYTLKDDFLSPFIFENNFSSPLLVKVELQTPKTLHLLQLTYAQNQLAPSTKMSHYKKNTINHQHLHIKYGVTKPVYTPAPFVNFQVGTSVNVDYLFNKYNVQNQYHQTERTFHSEYMPITLQLLLISQIKLAKWGKFQLEAASALLNYHIKPSSSNPTFSQGLTGALTTLNKMSASQYNIIYQIAVSKKISFRLAYACEFFRYKKTYLLSWIKNAYELQIGYKLY